jgi:hypothetical protein
MKINIHADQVLVNDDVARTCGNPQRELLFCLDSEILADVTAEHRKKMVPSKDP